MAYDWDAVFTNVTAGGSEYVFMVTYDSPGQLINCAALRTQLSAISIWDPVSANEYHPTLYNLVTLGGKQVSGDWATGPLFAAYRFVPPGGAWVQATHHGTWTVFIDGTNCVDDAGHSLPSGQMGQFVVDLHPPSAPVLTASFDVDHIDISWTASADVKDDIWDYDVYRIALATGAKGRIFELPLGPDWLAAHPGGIVFTPFTGQWPADQGAHFRLGEQVDLQVRVRDLTGTEVWSNIVQVRTNTAVRSMSKVFGNGVPVGA